MTTTFQKVFSEIPAGRSVTAHWATANAELLDAAACAIIAHDANPWVFAADWRHFDQFAGTAERAALAAMSASAVDALMGTREDWE